MKKYGFICLLTLLSLSSVANDHPYIVTGADMASSTKSLRSFQTISNDGEVIIGRATDSDKMMISESAHDKKRCAGYFAFETLEQAQKFVANTKNNNTTKLILADYTINQSDLVNETISRANELTIRETILKLSSFKNRFYKSKEGVKSQAWIKSHWEKLTARRNDVTVEYFNHKKWDQPSVIATIKGESDEVIIIGGHADSISGWRGGKNITAPGADDNASGIATITETLKVLIDSNYKPSKTIMFMAYAAEEVGLLGSKAIAKDFKERGKEVIGVMQLDMTNFVGSNDDITIFTDHTNEAQNKFVASLIDTYLTDLSWGTDKCGYACSDHASWTANGYPSSMPFESRMKEMNHKIHTKQDTLENTGGNADHALKFTRLALAFTIELDK